MLRYRNYKLIQEKIATRTRKDLQHLEDDGDSMDMQDGIEKENVQVGENGLQGKEVLDLQAKGDDNLNAKEEVHRVHSLEEETIHISNNSLPLVDSQNKDTGQLHTNTLQKTKLPVYSYSQSLFKRQGDIAGNSHEVAIIPGERLVANVCIHEFRQEDKK